MSYREGISDAYQGELIGEQLYAALANCSFHIEQKQKLAAIADVERHTHGRLRPIAERLGIAPEEADRQRIVARRLGELGSLAWPDFIEKACRDWPPLIARFESLKLLAPAGDEAAIQCLIDHEVALVEFVRLEKAGAGPDASLEKIRAFLRRDRTEGG